MAYAKGEYRLSARASSQPSSIECSMTSPVDRPAGVVAVDEGKRLSAAGSRGSTAPAYPDRDEPDRGADAEPQRAEQCADNQADQSQKQPVGFGSVLENAHRTPSIAGSRLYRIADPRSNDPYSILIPSLALSVLGEPGQIRVKRSVTMRPDSRPGRRVVARIVGSLRIRHSSRFARPWCDIDACCSNVLICGSRLRNTPALPRDCREPTRNGSAFSRCIHSLRKKLWLIGLSSFA